MCCRSERNETMRILFAAAGAALLAMFPTLIGAAGQSGGSEIDTTVKAFLDRHRGTWRDLNVPESDGKLLHDLILEHRFTRALEIGTSTGHSGVWIAWALAKTGGKLTTVEIDPERHRTAVANFKEAGLAQYIDARLGDAHEIVPALSGPFDFVFSDADKDWYKNYLVAVWPKMTPGGCFTAHNVSGRGAGGGIREFLDHLATLPDAVTTIDKSSRAGVSISCKKVSADVIERPRGVPLAGPDEAVE
jgi:predicted O-methyltransferase YrrM